jgi:hypothetical protein
VITVGNFVYVTDCTIHIYVTDCTIHIYVTDYTTHISKHVLSVNIAGFIGENAIKLHLLLQHSVHQYLVTSLYKWRTAELANDTSVFLHVNDVYMFHLLSVPTISVVVSLETMGMVVTDLMFHIFLRLVPSSLLYTLKNNS